jgi:NAD(P)-dependent dehydrogenase (short-subunit alcohol dehydrogenase family)
MTPVETTGTAVVTGGNAGLGLETVKAIGATGSFSDIVVAARDTGRASRAMAGLSFGSTALHIAPLDLASLDSVRQFPAALALLGLPPIGALVCNAGVQIVDGTRLTGDGVEETFAVNVLGHFLLTRLLLAETRPNARVIFISSGTHDPAVKTGMPEPRYSGAAELAAGHGFDDVSEGKRGRLRYTTSKLCDVYLSLEFAKRYPMGSTTGPSLVTSAMDPGLMAGSGLIRDYGMVARLVWTHVLPHVSRFMKDAMTTASSGLNVARLATEPEFGLTSGLYYIGATPASSSVLSYDQFNAVDLWSTCAALSGLEP